MGYPDFVMSTGTQIVKLLLLFFVLNHYICECLFSSSLIASKQEKSL